jgi:hypothetical protein
VQGTEVKELCAVERLWKTARDSETEEDKNCGSWTELSCVLWSVLWKTAREFGTVVFESWTVQELCSGLDYTVFQRLMLEVEASRLS